MLVRFEKIKIKKKVKEQNDKKEEETRREQIDIKRDTYTLSEVSYVAATSTNDCTSVLEQKKGYSHKT